MPTNTAAWLVAVQKPLEVKSLASGSYIAAPEPVVVGKGLDHIQAGLEAQRQGVSAKKVVVSLKDQPILVF